MVSGFGFRVSGVELRASGLRFRDSSFRFRVSGCGVQISGSGFRASGFGFRIPDSEFRVSGLRFSGQAPDRTPSAVGRLLKGGLLVSSFRLRVSSFGVRVPLGAVRPFHLKSTCICNQLKGQARCKFGHVTFGHPNERIPRTPVCGRVSNFEYQISGNVER